MTEAQLIQQGGPAFPFEDKYSEHGNLSLQPGMTLKDYFAAAALTGLLSRHEHGQLIDFPHVGTPAHAVHSAGKREDLAKLAYDLAEAMLLAREEILDRDESEGSDS